MAPLTFTPEGRLAVAGSENGDAYRAVVSFWNLENGKRDAEMNTRASWFNTYSADGKWMAGLGPEMDILVWDRNTMMPRYSGRRGISGGPLLFNKEGDTILACRWSCVELIDLKTGRDILLQEGHAGRVLALDINADGSAIVSGGDDGVVLLWDTKTGTPRRLEDTTGPGAVSVAFSPDGNTIAAANSFSGVVFWDAATGKEQQRVSLTHRDDFYRRATQIAFSHDGKTLGATASSKAAYQFFNTDPKALNPTPQWTFGESAAGREAPFRFSPDGKHFAGILANPDTPQRVCLWTMTGKAPVAIGAETQRVVDIAFSPDGDLLAWSDEKLVHLYDVREGKEIKTFKNAATTGCLAFTPDGRHLANGKTFHPLTEKAETVELPIQTSRLAFSRDGRVAVAVAEDGFTMLVFDMKKLVK